MNRAYSLLTVKRVDDEARVIEGVASTPNTDRQGDIVEPLGAKFTLPLPALLFHDAENPVASVEWAKAEKTGIPYRMRFPKAGVLESVDKAWTLVKERLVRGVSIGFRPLETEPIKGSRVGGIRFIRWEWLELSLVAIPANAEATISTIKQFDSKTSAALGEDSRGVTRPVNAPGASGITITGIVGFPKGKHMKTYQERLTELQTERGVKATRIKELAEGVDGDFDSLSAENRAEYDGLVKELDDIDGRVRDVRGVMRAIDGAVSVAGDTEDAGRKSRSGIPAVATPPEQKGMGFTRFAIAVAKGRGSVSDALAYAKDRWPDQPQVQTLIKANVGTTATGNWASSLATPQFLQSEFIDLVRPATILGRVPGLRAIPFNVKVKIITGGSTVAWVGEGAAKPVGEMTFSDLTVPRTKVAGIIVLSDELIADSSPDAEEMVRTDLVAQTAKYLDEQAFTPSVTASAGIRPASLTNTAVNKAAGGTTQADMRADIAWLVSKFTDIGLSSAVFIMGSNAAISLSMMVNSLGQPVNAGMTMNGGTLMGIPVIVSDNIPGDSTGTLIILMKANEIYLAQDGAVRLDASKEATLDLAGGTSPTYSLFQRNAVAIRAERAIHWIKRRANAVAYISGADYAV